MGGRNNFFYTPQTTPDIYTRHLREEPSRSARLTSTASPRETRLPGPIGVWTGYRMGQPGQYRPPALQIREYRPVSHEHKFRSHLIMLEALLRVPFSIWDCCLIRLRVGPSLGGCVISTSNSGLDNLGRPTTAGTSDLLKKPDSHGWEELASSGAVLGCTRNVQRSS